MLVRKRRRSGVGLEEGRIPLPRFSVREPAQETASAVRSWLWLVKDERIDFPLMIWIRPEEWRILEGLEGENADVELNLVASIIRS